MARRPTVPTFSIMAVSYNKSLLVGPSGGGLEGEAGIQGV